MTEEIKEVDSNPENDGISFEEDPAELEETGEDQETTDQEEKLFDQEAANKAFIRNKQLLRKEQQEKEEARKEAEELRKKLAAFEKETAPIIPEIPDQYDDDYEQKIMARDEAIKKNVAFQEKQLFLQEQKRNEQLKMQSAQQEETARVLKDYRTRVKDLGLTEMEQIKNEDTVALYINNQDVAKFILSHENGPLIVNHLAMDATELEKISQMAPMQAAVYISNVIAPNAERLKPTTTKTPEPAPIQHGNGYIKKDPLLAGVTFE